MPERRAATSSRRKRQRQLGSGGTDGHGAAPALEQRLPREKLRARVSSVDDEHDLAFLAPRVERGPVARQGRESVPDASGVRAVCRRVGDVHRERELGLAGHADLGAFEPVGGRAQDGAPLRRGRGELQREHEVPPVAEARQRLGHDAHGRGPEKRRRRPAGRQSPGERGAHARVAGVLPIGVPAGLVNEAKARGERLAGNDGRARGDQLGAHGARGGEGGQGQQREQERLHPPEFNS